ncbi:DUF2207 family protein [Streptococcus caprae]|uniref:DUF2207 family protein n=1 Tax=Streptococcus caprae TaxID=1640501 RepID=A0ABV8CWZ3_9STRE
MKKYLGMMIVFLGLIWTVPVQAVDYDITSYVGDLQLTEENKAVYTETVTYEFDDDYNGQYVTLGEAGTLPLGFTIDGADVSVKINGEDSTVGAETSLSRITDGYQYKIYNGGQAGDVVEVRIIWQMTNLLNVYQDIAELHWVPISDWDEDLGEVTLTISGLPVQGSALYAHTGYFRTQPNISRGADGTYTVNLSHLSAGRPLELHASWPVSVLSNSARLDSLSEYKAADFKQTEANIAKNTKKAKQIFYLIIPFSTMGLCLLAVMVFEGMKKFFHRNLAGKDLKARLYEPPGNLSPLVLSQQVFGLDVLEANQAGLSKNVFSFENLIQATILDLIDRGNITVTTHHKTEKKEFHLKDYDQLSDSEQVLVLMAFNGNVNKSASEIFEQYHIAPSLLNTKDKTKESSVRSKGREVGKQFDADLRLLKQTVDQELERDHVGVAYRPLGMSEWLWLLLTNLLALAPIVVVLLSMAYLATAFSTWLWLYPALLLLGLGTLYWVSRHHYVRDGVLTLEGAEEYYRWHAFKNMIHDIGHMDKVELEGLVLWNRILVYATLFGEAEKVSRAIKVHNIQLPSSDVADFYVNPYAYSGFYRSTHGFSQTSQLAHQAENFHVPSSSSGSGGFSGGGFSGGFGGGGGGAF